jgi:adenine-specific DNA-methyltransferase
MAQKTKKLDQYEHRDKARVNNPPVGLVTAETDPESRKKGYEYDPHLDPQLIWAGKVEHTSFEVSTVSLHVHERIDPHSIIETVKKKEDEKFKQLPLFALPEENPPLREAIEFYKHKHNWSNRLIAGDSILVMNSLLEKEGMAGQVQMIYIDPPYGIKYGSNFQPFVNKRDVKDGKDEDLTAEPEMIKAFRDTWELGIHSYLTYLRDRLLSSRELLHETGSIFVQISDENVHHVRELMDEIFGNKNFVSQIIFSKTAGGLESVKRISTRIDYIIWYSKNFDSLKYRPLFVEQIDFVNSGFNQIELRDGIRRSMSMEEKQNPSLIPKNSKVYLSMDLTKPGPGSKYEVEFEGKTYTSGKRWWGTPKESLERLIKSNRIFSTGKKLRYLRYFLDFPYKHIDNLWDGFGGAANPSYVVQTNDKIIERCMLMTTDPGDLVLDPTCGSGTTAYVAERWGRRWITCDTSRVAITLAKQRLMTALFDYYVLAHPDEGVSSGFKYKTVPHITLKSIANNEPLAEEILYDQPYVDKSIARVTGPFTVEAVPSPIVKSLDEIGEPKENNIYESDVSMIRSGETHRQSEWRDELFNNGIRGKGGQKIEFTRLEPLPGTRWLHADGETKGNDRQRVVVSFGPEHAPLEQRQVEFAIKEALNLVPKPRMIVFASFQFDPEAAKDIDEINWSGVTLLKVQMNADLLTDDLKKKRASNESFWLIGQPDVQLKKIKDEEGNDRYCIEVMGFDYYNTKAGIIESGGKEKIAMWMLDPDYDGRSLFPKQVFFPLAEERDGWSKLARNLKAEIDEALIERYHGTISLPFDVGDNKRIAVKIVDDRGIESLKIIEVQ